MPSRASSSRCNCSKSRAMTTSSEAHLVLKVVYKQAETYQIFPLKRATTSERLSKPPTTLPSRQRVSSRERSPLVSKIHYLSALDKLRGTGRLKPRIDQDLLRFSLQAKDSKNSRPTTASATKFSPCPCLRRLMRRVPTWVLLAPAVMD